MTQPRPADAVVVSPHLDDAILSLGATVAGLARNGLAISVVTVFAGDTSSAKPCGGWDERAGFATEGEAARARRAEDERACDIIGARPVWLPFSEADYRDATLDDEAITEALLPFLETATMTYLPGFPLTNPDHAYLSKLVLESRPAIPRIALYAEQPYRYQVRREHRRPVTPLLPRQGRGSWTRGGLRRFARVAKRRAILAYSSQVSLLGLDRDDHKKLDAMLRHEALHGGEAVCLLA